jgi:hypothetical protein
MYGSEEYQYECAMHDNCIFAFKFTLLPEGYFRFRLNRGYHQCARVKLNYCRDYQYMQRKSQEDSNNYVAPRKRKRRKPSESPYIEEEGEVEEPDKISVQKSSSGRGSERGVDTHHSIISPAHCKEATLVVQNQFIDEHNEVAGKLISMHQQMLDKQSTALESGYFFTQ